MLLIFIDANAVHRDPWMTRDAAEKLVALAGSGACVVLYPQVVIDELRRQRVDAAREAHEHAAAGIEQMGAAGVDVAQTVDDLGVAYDRIEADIDSAFAALLARGGVRAVPVPSTATQDLLLRDLDRRRPFLEIEQGKKRKSLGFRDVLIWESVLDLLQASASDDTVLFVTFDKGFLADDNMSLHPHLMEDLDRLKIPHDRIAWSRSIAEAIPDVEAQKLEVLTADATPAEEGLSFEPSPEEGDPGLVPSEDPVAVAVNELKQIRSVERTDLVKAASDALYGLMYESVSEQLVHGGDYGYPAFVKFTVPAIEGATITGIDQTTEFSFSEDPTSPDALVGTTDAVITLEGGVHRGDWFIDDGLVSIVGELNDHYLEAIAEVEVRVIVELDIESGAVTVIDAVLEDAPLSDPRDYGAAELDLPDMTPLATQADGDARQSLCGT